MLSLQLATQLLYRLDESYHHRVFPWKLFLFSLENYFLIWIRILIWTILVNDFWRDEWFDRKRLGNSRKPRSIVGISVYIWCLQRRARTKGSESSRVVRTHPSTAELV
jgi:hypothetical protein